MDNQKLQALASICSAVGIDPDTSKRILCAAKGDKDMPKERDEALTARQAAEILKCHPKSLRRYERAGKLQGIRRSARCVRWLKSEVETLAFGRAG